MPPRPASTPTSPQKHHQTPADPPPSPETWVAILLPIHNEPAPILNRLLQASTSIHHHRYDVIIADDSTAPKHTRH